jgi:hypothetical protein
VGGLYNDGRRIKAYFNLNLAPMHMALRGLKLWMRAELGLIGIRWTQVWRKKPAGAIPESRTETPQT